MSGRALLVTAGGGAPGKAQGSSCHPGVTGEGKTGRVNLTYQGAYGGAGPITLTCRSANMHTLWSAAGAHWATSSMRPWSPPAISPPTCAPWATSKPPETWTKTPWSTADAHDLVMLLISRSSTDSATTPPPGVYAGFEPAQAEPTVLRILHRTLRQIPPPTMCPGRQVGCRELAHACRVSL